MTSKKNLRLVCWELVFICGEVEVATPGKLVEVLSLPERIQFSDMTLWILCSWYDCWGWVGSCYVPCCKVVCCSSVGIGVGIGQESCVDGGYCGSGPWSCGWPRSR